MARIAWNAPYGFDFTGFNLSSFNAGTSYTKTPTLFAVTYASYSGRDEFRGYGFTYGSGNLPIDGTVTSYSAFQSGKKLGFIDGLNLPAAAFAEAAQTAFQSDDLALYRLALAGSDMITGGKASDRLEGFDGKDKITGGGGGDRLYGGTGADTFIFKTIRDSTVAKSGRDTIYDFSTKQKDKISLSAIDANHALSGNQAFTFVGKEQFHEKAGELRYVTAKGYTYVSGDVDGDRNADFSIVLKGALHLTKSDFIL